MERRSLCGREYSVKQRVVMSKDVRRRGRRRAQRKNGKKKKLTTWQKVLIGVIIFLVCVIGMSVAYVYAKWSKIDTKDIKAEDIVINEEVKLNKELDLGDGYKNVALFGVDSRDGNLGEGNRTDCIIVASLNNETKEIKMVSVYRDTLLNLSEGTYQKCNGAYSYGGPVLAINMLNMNLDLDIEDYVTVDFGAISDAIDLLGGVEIDIKEEEIQYLNKYIKETARSAGKKANKVTEAGLQLLDGPQATTYARIRSTAGGDFTRTERQRLVIEKMFEKAKNADLGTLNEIINKVFPQVSTSFTLQEILMYASAYSEYTLSDNMGFPVDKYTDTVSGLGSIVIPSDLTSNVTKLHEFLFGTTGYTPSATVQDVSSTITYTVNSAGSATTPESYDDYDSYDYDDYDYSSDYDSSYSDDSSDDDYYEEPSGGYDDSTDYEDSGGSDYSDTGGDDTGSGGTGDDGGGSGETDSGDTGGGEV